MQNIVMMFCCFMFYGMLELPCSHREGSLTLFVALPRMQAMKTINVMVGVLTTSVKATVATLGQNAQSNVANAQWNCTGETTNVTLYSAIDVLRMFSPHLRVLSITGFLAR